MGTEWVALGNAVLEWLKSPVKIVFIIWCSGVLLLSSPLWVNKTPLHLAPLASNYATAISLVVLVSSVYLLTELCLNLWKRYGHPILVRRKNHHMERQLLALPPDEKHIVVKILRSTDCEIEERHQNGRLQHGGAYLDLISKGVLAGGVTQSFTTDTYTSFRFTPLANSCARKPHVRDALLATRND